MDNPFPIPQQLRESDVFVGDDGQTYGPFNFKIFDIDDVEVWTRPDADSVFIKQGSVLVAKTNGDPFDNFTVTFPADQPDTTEIVVRSKRLDSRAAGVMSGTRIDPTAMEKEFSKISTEMQEVRRDVDRTVNVPFGETPFQILPGTAGQVPVFDDDGNLIPGTPAGGGNMMREIYDPQNIAADAFDRANHTGEQATSTITGLTGALSGLQTDIDDLGTEVDGLEAAIPSMIDAKIWRKSLTDYGAVGDGVTNDTAAVNAAFAAAVPLTGRKKTYAVSGDVTMPAGLDLEDATFKQLTPNNAARKTLYANAVSNITLKRVKVDRNGSGTGGSLGGAAGIWIDGGSLHTVDDCEVFGSDAGSGMVFNGCSNFKVNRPYVHDILYVAASLPADDQCMAILFNGCTNFSIFEPRINHLGGIVGGSFRRAFGRMLCFGFGCSEFRVYGGEIQDGDVGIDLSGSKGNTFYSVIGVTVRNVETWGIKQSNYNRFGRIVACDVYRAGSAGYVLSGPTVNVDPDTPMPASAPRNITIIGCGAWDTGNGNTGRGTSQPAGFLIIPGGASSYQDYPRGVRFVSCTAVDTQAVKTQYHGFRNEISYGGVPLNEMVDCRSEGYAAGGQHSAGFHYPACRVYNSAAVAIPNNTTTAIGFDSEDYDGSAMHSTSVNNDAIFVPHPGWYHIDAEATVVANATGSRFLGITVGGVSVPRLRDQSPGLSSNDHTLKLSGDVYISDVAGGIRLTLLQNSGGNLNVLANASLSVRQVLFN
ncbi:hypothetical protein ACC783_23610 [Rhizobium ruizarguesonis]